MSVDVFFEVRHAAVTDLDCVSFKKTYVKHTPREILSQVV